MEGKARASGDGNQHHCRKATCRLQSWFSLHLRRPCKASFHCAMLLQSAVFAVTTMSLPAFTFDSCVKTAGHITILFVLNRILWTLRRNSSEITRNDNDGMYTVVHKKCGNTIAIITDSFDWFLQRAQCSHCKRCISYSNSVCLSVTRRYCVKTTARSTVQFALLDSKMCLVL